MLGLHASPFHGFSVEFSGVPQRYTSGDNISDIDRKRLREDRPVLHQEVPGRDEPHGLPRDGPSGSMGYTHRQ